MGTKVIRLSNQEQIASHTQEIINNVRNNPGQFEADDYIWLLSTLHQAITHQYKVELHLETPDGYYQEIKGYIKETVILVTDDLMHGNIHMDLQDANHNEIAKIRYDNISIQNTEENRNSIPGQTMKYYLEDDNHQVLVGIIVNYQ